MNVYIDLGCYDGDTVEEFRNWRRVAFPDKEEWTIYAFDPNPSFSEAWANKTDKDTSFIKQAAWIEDGETEFAVDQSDSPVGSTIMQGKRKVWEASPKIKVKTFDFSHFLKSVDEDFVVVKMDIEGAEFKVLDKMIRDGTDKICKWLLIEFHPNKVVEYTTKDKLNLLEVLRARNPNVLEWH